MSSALKFILILLLILNCCASKNSDSEIFYNATPRKISAQSENQNSNIQQEIISNQSNFFNSFDLVNNILGNKNKDYKIGFVLPISGQYASIGKAIIDSTILTISNSKFGNNIAINIYDISKISSKEAKTNKEIQKLLNDQNDLIIGSIFPETTKALLDIIPNDQLLISFSNNEGLKNNYSNLVSFEANDSAKFQEIFNYLKVYNKKIIASLLPATKRGYALDKKLKDSAKTNKFLIVATEFYQENDQDSIRNAIEKINRSYKTSYLIDNAGNLIIKSFKEAKKEDKNIEISENNKKNILIESIWISSDESNLAIILSEINKIGFFEKDIIFFTDSAVDYNTFEHSYSYLNKINLIGYDYNYISKFNRRFSNIYGYSPNSFVYLSHDILSTVFYLFDQKQMLPSEFYSDDGFHGILDDFRFSRNGKTERNFGIYNFSITGSLETIYKKDNFY